MATLVPELGVALALLLPDRAGVFLLEAGVFRLELEKKPEL